MMPTYHQIKSNPSIDDSTKIVSFRRQRPNAELRPVPYRPYAPLYQDLKKELDAYLDKLFAGEIDDANSDVLDSIITDRIRQAIRDLSDQRINHTMNIYDLDIDAKGKRQACEDNLAQLMEMLEAKEQEYQEFAQRAKNTKWRK